MTFSELRERLYAARTELTRVIIKTSRLQVDEEVLERLIEQRDLLVAQINRLVFAEVNASLAQVQLEIDALDEATRELAELTVTSERISKAIDIASKIVSAAAAVLTKL